MLLVSNNRKERCAGFRLIQFFVHKKIFSVHVMDGTHNLFHVSPSSLSSSLPQSKLSAVGWLRFSKDGITITDGVTVI